MERGTCGGHPLISKRQDRDLEAGAWTMRMPEEKLMQLQGLDVRVVNVKGGVSEVGIATRVYLEIEIGDKGRKWEE